MEKKKLRRALMGKLFLSNLSISACTFGGGFVIVTFMKNKYVEKLGWLTEEEMLDITAMAQSAPGAIAVNASILVGWKVAGFWGMVISVLGTILPPMLILSVISLGYKAFAANPYAVLVLQGMQAGVAAVICDVVCNLGGKITAHRSLLQVCMMLFAFAAAWFLKVNVVLIILMAVLVGMVSAMWKRRRVRAK